VRTEDDDIARDHGRSDELAERGRALVAAAVSGSPAPPALRERLEDQRRALDPSRRRRRAAFGALLAGGTAVVLALALVVLPGGSPGGAPTIVEAAQAGVRAPQDSAPAADSANPGLLLAEEGGIRFPTWRAFDWTPTGLREDEIGGRHITTIYYDAAGRGPAAYSIVDGAALDPPRGARRHDVAGMDVRSLRADGRWIVTWQRDGRTCIVTAPATMPLERLVAVPAWE
jgi:hypothetical protein